MIDNIRNFCIIAHVDHGKTTLTDRLLEIATLGDERKLAKKDRVTDVLEIEQERGITIKLQPATMSYRGYNLNLIDTPGHVDFSYEVSRSLKACEGAILVIDVTQGIQAQTLANMLLAMEHNLTIIPVLNKVDIGRNLVPQRLEEIKIMLGFTEDEVILASGKTGEGALEILDAVIEKIPAPKDEFGQNKVELDPKNSYAKALIFDSFYDDHKGIVASVRVFKGEISADQKLYLINAGEAFVPKEIGIFTPEMRPTDKLTSGNVGYIATGVKEIKKVNIGETISNIENASAIEGYQKPQSKVFASLYPDDKGNFEELKISLEKLALNDSALNIKAESSAVLGQGFRVGFLGILHLEITRERLEREFNVETIVTIPTVEYKIYEIKGDSKIIQSAFELPDQVKIKKVEEPFIRGEVLTPSEYIGAIYTLMDEFRGQVKNSTTLLSNENSSLNYMSLEVEMPFSELLLGFFNSLKSYTHGYASFYYDKVCYKETRIVKVDILVAKEIVPPFSFLEVPEKARSRAVKILEKLKYAIPRHLFPIPLQATIGTKVIARETISPYRKDVTAKLYGGDVTRKLKLLENQKRKKKEMQEDAKVRIPPSAYAEVLK